MVVLCINGNKRSCTVAFFRREDYILAVINGNTSSDKFYLWQDARKIGD